MLWWILGGIVVAFVLLYVISSWSMAKDQERFERDGDLAKCWISSAGDDLYVVHNVSGAGDARVVFLLDDLPKKNAVLKEITERLTNGEKEDDSIDTGSVNMFFEKINSQTYLDPPVRMPKWLVGDRKAYTGMMQVYWKKLPEKKLTKSYVYGRFLLGEKGGIRHVPYPENSAKSDG